VTLLVLGGTAEGRLLAERLHALGEPVVSSLAGRVSAPRLPAGEVRVGGFGGTDGLAAFLRDRGVTAVADATHPFAARITAHAAAAGAAVGVPLVVLRRPAWPARPGWVLVPDLAAAASYVAGLPADATVLLTTGRQGVAAFAGCPQRFWLRAVEPPVPPLPGRCEVLLDRGPYPLDGELALLRRLDADVLVTKNSGGPLTAAKLDAAEALGIPVVVVSRPPLPDGVPVVADVGAALDRLLSRPAPASAPSGARPRSGG